MESNSATDSTRGRPCRRSLAPPNANFGIVDPMHRIALACAALSLAACAAPASELKPPTVLTYGYGHRSGSASLTLEQDGSAHFSRTGYPEGTEEYDGKVDPKDIEQIRKVLVENSFCSLRSRRSRGVLDEARPEISVRLEGLDCRVELWDGEWRDRPAAQASLRAVENLASKLAALAKKKP